MNDTPAPKEARRPFERPKTFEQIRKERELDGPVASAEAAKSTGALVKKDMPRAIVKADDDSDVFDLSLLDDPKYIDGLTDNANQPQWRHRVTASDTLKIVHKPNKSQKAFEISITDQSGNTKELLVFVKRHSKDPYNKDGNDTVEDTFEKCLVTFAGSPDQTKMARHLQESINATLAEGSAGADYFTEKNTSDRHETEIARYSVASSYRDTNKPPAKRSRLMLPRSTAMALCQPF